MPKSGSLSILNYLFYLDNKKLYKNPRRIANANAALCTWKNNRVLIKEKAPKCFRFTFVKHPLKRAYSLYLEHFLSKTKFSFEQRKEEWITLYNPNFSSTYSIERERKNFFGFLNYIEDSLTEKSTILANPNWQSQSSIIENSKTKYRLNFIGRVETFNEDFNFVLSKVGYENYIDLKPINLPKRKDFIPFEQILTPAIEKLGRHIYADDYFQFGYDKA